MFIIYLLIFTIAVSFSWITVPLVNDYAKKNYLYNKPSERGQKKSLIVRSQGPQIEKVIPKDEKVG